MVFIDQLTKWPIVVPVKATTKEELIKSLETAVMPNHGYMDTLICNQGGAYISDKFKKYASDRNFRLNYVAKGNHKANGLAERLVKEVHAAINKLANGNFK